MSFTSALESIPIVGQAGAGLADIGKLATGKPLYPVYALPSTENARLTVVTEAANKYHISPVILWGVYGAETSHGADVTTSSTGAKGSFQFEPETAKQFGYPYTNATDPKTFKLQAEGAARYLASLLPGGKGEAKGLKGGKWTQAWERALRAYSGGGYGLAHVKQTGSSAAMVAGTEEANQAEKSKVEGEETSGGLFGPLIAFFTGWAVKGVLLLAGVLLMIYGVAVAVRPRERAFSIPIPA